MAQAHAANADKYYVPHESKWPIIGSLALFVLMLGVVSYLNHWLPSWAMVPGFAFLAYMFIGWFSTVIDENQQGMYNMAVDRSFRMGMMWFIFSEVMFFAAFFGALFYARSLAVPWLGGEGVKIFSNHLLWPSYENAWPTNGPAQLSPREDGTYEIVPAFGLPAINTMILLLSGVTVTIAHHALRAGQRGKLNLFLFFTFALGFLFVGLQAYEYHHEIT
jgi:cytochrome c oxidase subunit 3